MKEKVELTRHVEHNEAYQYLQKREYQKNRRERKRQTILEEIMAENFLDLLKHSNLHIQDAQ